MNETDTLMLDMSKVWNTVLYYEQLIKGSVCWQHTYIVFDNIVGKPWVSAF